MRWATAIWSVAVSGRRPMVSNGPAPMLTMMVVNRSSRRPGRVVVSMLRSRSRAIPRSGRRSAAAPATGGRPSPSMAATATPTRISAAERLTLPDLPSRSLWSAGLEGGRRAGRGGHRPKRRVGLAGRGLQGWDRGGSHLGVGTGGPRPADRPDLTQHRQGIGHHLDLAALTLQGLDADLGHLQAELAGQPQHLDIKGEAVHPGLAEDLLGRCPPEPL